MRGSVVDVEERSCLSEPTGHPWGPFLLHECIGRGASSRVYRCTSIDGPRVDLALKIPTRRRVRTRMLREARIGRWLSHPGIVKVRAAGHHAGQTYLLMDLVDGLSVGQLRTRVGAFELPAAARIVYDAAAAVGAAHRARGPAGELRIVHRDIKPGNILLDRCGRVRVTDFGIAGSAHWDDAGSFSGTPGYMTLEAIRAESEDARVDVFGLGATLVALVLGRAPWPRSPLWTYTEGCLDPREALRRSGAAATLRRISPRLLAIAERALAADPADRHPSAESFASEVADLPMHSRRALSRWDALGSRTACAGLGS